MCQIYNGWPYIWFLIDITCFNNLNPSHHENKSIQAAGHTDPADADPDGLCILDRIL
jgi:hypothetical protein